MNLDNFASSIRLLLGYGGMSSRKVSRFKEFLKASGIGTVYIRSGRNNDHALPVARLLNDTSKVVIECDTAAYQALRKTPPEDMANIELLPAFDIGDSIARFRKIIRMLPPQNKAQYVFIKNDGKLVDKKRTKKVFDAIIKETEAKNVKFYWDCGFVLCSFTEDALGYFIEKGSEVLFCCQSVMCVDAELNIHICEKLKGRAGGASIPSGTSFLGAMGEFNKALMPYQSFGIFRQCSGCRFLVKVCAGGCKAAVIQGFR